MSPRHGFSGAHSRTAGIIHRYDKMNLLDPKLGKGCADDTIIFLFKVCADAFVGHSYLYL